MTDGASAFVQWKGTDACIDFHCRACGYGGHYDGLFAYTLRCSGCGRLYSMPHTFQLEAVEDDGGVVVDTDNEHATVREQGPDVVEIADDRDDL